MSLKQKIFLSNAFGLYHVNDRYVALLIKTIANKKILFVHLMTQYKLFILVLCLISVIFGQNDFRLTKTEDINSIDKIDSSLFHQNGDNLFIILTDDNSVTKVTVNGQDVTASSTKQVGSLYEFSLLVKTDTSYGYLFSGRSTNDSRPSGVSNLINSF